MSEKFEKLRFRVAKTGRAKYISHLDFVRCVQRAIRRSGLPVHYTNGFHPHMEAVFATALPLGMESIGEVLEIRFAEPVEPEAARTCLQAALPEGMELLQVYQPVHKMGELAYVRYRVTIPSEQPEQLFEQWHAFLQQPEVLVEKKSKRGMRTVDLLPQIDCQVEQVIVGALVLEWMLSVGQPESVNPNLIVTAFTSFAGMSAEQVQICRTQLCTAEQTEFL